MKRRRGRKIENRKLCIEDICLAVIEKLVRLGYLEWKRQPAEKEEPEAKLNKHVILERDIKEIGNSGICRAAVGKNAIITDLAKEYADKKGIVIYREEGEL